MANGFKMAAIVASLGCVAVTSASTLVHAAIVGTYEVPASPELESPVTFPVNHARLVEQSDGTYRLDYRLPRELDGAVPQAFRLQSASAGTPLQLVGNHVTATCTTDAADLSCSMKYVDLSLNEVASDAYLAAHVNDPATVALYKTARSSLMHQAMGIVTIKRHN